MNKNITTLYTAAFSGLISVAGMAPAVADSLVHRDFQEENRYIGDFCDPSSGESFGMPKIAVGSRVQSRVSIARIVNLAAKPPPIFSGPNLMRR